MAPPSRPAIPPPAEPPPGQDTRPDLEYEAFASEHRRTERLRNLWAIWAYALLSLIALVVFVIIFAVAWHYLAPREWAWLNREQLAAIRTFLFSGTVVAVAAWLGNYIRHRL